MLAATTRERVLESASRLFAQRGYAGASVRHICEEAGASANAVHYHFGSKQQLYEALLERFVAQRLATAERMLAGTPPSLAELRVRLELFCDETMVALLDDKEVLTIALDAMLCGFPHGGEAAAEAIRAHEHRLAAFLTRARDGGLLRADVDTAIVAGTLLERIINQARYAEVHETLWDTTPRDPGYRRHWIGQMVDLCLYGAVERSKE